MFKNTYTVIYLKRNSLVVVKTKGGKLRDKARADWDSANLAEVLKAIADKYPSKEVKVILADEITYAYKVNVKGSFDSQKLKDALFEKLKSDVPEKQLSDELWGYVVSGEDQDTKSIILFAVVNKIFSEFLQGAHDAGFKISKVEPEVVTQLKDEDPFIGISKPLSGVNKPLVLKKVQSQEVDQKENSWYPKNKIILFTLCLLALFCLFVIGFGLIKVTSTKSISNEPASGEIKTEPSLQPSPTPTPVDLSSVSILIQNGSGRSGESAYVEEILTDEGFADIATQNADSFDYEKTEVSLKQEYDGFVYENIERALNSIYDLEKKVLTQNQEYDVVIVVGERLQ